MKYLSIVIAVMALLAGCSRPHPATAFTVDQFFTVALQYHGTRALDGADTYGPADKEFACERSAEAAVAQAQQFLPPQDTLVTTCLHVKFGGPLPRGVAVALPVTGSPFEWMTVGVEYTRAGKFVGAQALHPAPDAKTCLREARDLLRSNYADGHVGARASLLLYCMPVPAIDAKAASQGGIV